MSHDTGDPKQLEPALIVHRLVALNMVAIHTTSFTTTNTILDLYSSPPSAGFVEALREESNCVHADYGGSWTGDAVSKLYRIDSTIMESMRLSAFGIVALTRRVYNPFLGTLPSRTLMNLRSPHLTALILRVMFTFLRASALESP